MPCRKFGNRQSKDVCEVIHSDICGPMSTKSLNGKQYFATFVDDYSKYVSVVSLKTKDEIKHYIKKCTYSQHGTRNGKESQKVSFPQRKRILQSGPKNLF